MSADAILLVGAGALFVVATLSGRLERLWVSEPMLATFLGVGGGYRSLRSSSSSNRSRTRSRISSRMARTASGDRPSVRT